MGNNPRIHRRNIQRTLPYPTGSSTPQARVKLALLVPLLALAILLLVPAVVFAAAPAVPQGLTATSGDGTMVLNWEAADRATGYEYRWSDSSGGLLAGTGCDGEIECQWQAATTGNSNTTYTIPKGTLTVGDEYRYWFQVRAVNTNDSPTSNSGPSATVSAVQRALPPAVVFAAAPAVPQGLTATSGDGTMVLTWKSAARATGGYQYRYADSATALLLCANPPTTTKCQWTDATDNLNATTITIAKGTLTVGTTYWFQVRAVNTNDDPDTYSDPSATVSAVQRALPPKVENLVATPGSQQVTLTWTHPSAYSIFNYQIRQDDGSGWGSWTDTTIALPEGEGTVTYTVSGLVNGTEYSFLVRGQNFKGDGPDGDFVTVTPSGPPAAPRDLTAQGQSSVGTDVKLTWADPEDSNIDEYQYRVRVNGGSVWDPDWTLVPNSGAGTTTHTVDGLASGTPGYEFQVRALDTDRLEGDRAGPHSSVTGTPTTSETAPEAMTNVRHTVTGVIGGAGGRVTFTWDDPGDDSIDKYQYRYDNESNNPVAWDLDWTDIPGRTNNKDMTSWGPVGIHGSGTTTFYELRAINTSPDPDLPGPASAITIERKDIPSSTITTPGAPAGLTATAAWTDPNWDVTLSWTGFSAVADTIIDKYQYQQSVDGGDYTAWADIPSSVSTTKAHTFTGVAGTVYVFKLRGVDTGADPEVDGVPATSNPVTPGAPDAPTSLEPNDPRGFSRSPFAIDFDWTEGGDVAGVIVTGYEYRYRVGAEGSWSKWADTTHGTESDGLLPPVPGTSPDLEGNTKYDFQVRAMAGTIPSGPSYTSSGITLVLSQT